jgi:hypothetical protein
MEEGARADRLLLLGERDAAIADDLVEKPRGSEDGRLRAILGALIPQQHRATLIVTLDQRQRARGSGSCRSALGLIVGGLT